MPENTIQIDRVDELIRWHSRLHESSGDAVPARLPGRVRSAPEEWPTAQGSIFTRRRELVEQT
jgi:hypothetical protein